MRREDIQKRETGKIYRGQKQKMMRGDRQGDREMDRRET